MCPAVPMMSGMLGGRPGNHGGCGERSGGARRQPRCQMAARSSLLRRIAALPALAPRLVRLARHDYSDRLLGWIVVLALAVLPACGRQEAVETTAAAEPRLTPAQLSFLKFAPVAEVEATSLA